MAETFPRVTYSNIDSDFTALHDYLDVEIPRIKEAVLGQYWPNLVGGHRCERGEQYEVRSPIDNQQLMGSFVCANLDAVDNAMRHARKAYRTWSRTPWEQRVKHLLTWADELERSKFELSVALLVEVGKSRAEALGEVEEVLDMIRFYCGEMERNNGYMHDMQRAFDNEETRNLLRPIGVFAVISPFNFPLALSVGMMTGALLGGNTVVYKPSRNSGLTGQLLLRALCQVGLGDYVSILNGGDETGQLIIDHQDLDGVAFTGSNHVGMNIFRSLAKNRYARPVLAEMGGKNPAYVTASADLSVAARGVARSAYGLQGQKCSACSVVYVDARVEDAFLRELNHEIDKLTIGNPEDRSVFMGPVYNSKAATKYDEVIATARNEQQLLRGGEANVDDHLRNGHYRQPALIKVPKGHSLTKDELFLPILAVRTYNSLAEALEEGNAVDYGLTAGIYTKDQNDLQMFLDDAQAGALYVNRPHGATTGAWPGIQSFCGWKGSGISQKGGLGPHYVPQFMREQSHTILHEG